MSKRINWRATTKRVFEIEDWVADLFRGLGYGATIEGEIGDLSVDILVERDGVRTPVEIVAVRGSATMAKVRADAERIRSYRALEPNFAKPIIVVISTLSVEAKAWTESQYDVEVWDLEVLRERTAGLPALSRRLHTIVAPDATPVPEPPDPVNERLREELTEHIVTNTLSASGYEDLCMRVFIHLFDPDLYGFEKQAETTDGANRYDFICRIKAGNTFWDGLRSDFRTKAVLFECKNYSEGITADQVYSTERYLFAGALRTVCLLTSRLPAKVSALRAAQAAMRETGKLVLLLANEDLIQMLKLKSQPGAAEDYLDKRIWDFVVSLPR
jgi:hypothetical protein